jgi:hypothetical protein
MTGPSAEQVRYKFADLAVQYFIAGRAAAIHQSIPVLGNLLHHAVEMSLKAVLATHLTLPQLRGLKHDLPKIWSRFKDSFSPPDATRFDLTVEELHRFEDLRYPDVVVAQGALMEFCLFREHLPPGPRSRSPAGRYTLVLEDVDELEAFIFKVARLNPKAFFAAITPSGREYLLKHNNYAAEW